MPNTKSIKSQVFFLGQIDDPVPLRLRAPLLPREILIRPFFRDYQPDKNCLINSMTVRICSLVKEEPEGRLIPCSEICLAAGK
jgi:hypothetical protein